MTGTPTRPQPELVTSDGGPSEAAREPELPPPGNDRPTVVDRVERDGRDRAEPAGRPGSGRAEPVGWSEVAELRREAGRLVTETAGPLRRIHLRSGDAVLEIEWHADVAPPDGAVSGGMPVDPGTPTVDNGTPRLDAGTVEADVTSVGPAAGTDLRRTVLAPMVGTYYQAAEPGGPPFVEVGDKVEPGQVVGIVEAMKLMNEVVAEQVGRVVEVLVHDGEPVEFGQPLIALVPA